MFDSVDVPAAVVCAICGKAECAGCDLEVTRSGVVALVPWERPGLPFSTRLWLTARASARDAERFFEYLPDGAVVPALRFAVACELLSTTAMALLIAPLLFALAPAWALHVASDPATRELAARIVLAGVPGVAVIMVIAHLVHGLALSWGARRAGARPAVQRAMRFGLYATGWDLVLGPVGAAVLVWTEGVRAAFTAMGDGVGLPTRSARAFIKGAYRLEGEGARRPLMASTVAAIATTVVGAVTVLAALIALALC